MPPRPPHPSSSDEKRQSSEPSLHWVVPPRPPLTRGRDRCWQQKPDENPLEEEAENRLSSECIPRKILDCRERRAEELTFEADGGRLSPSMKWDPVVQAVLVLDCSPFPEKHFESFDQSLKHDVDLSNDDLPRRQELLSFVPDGFWAHLLKLSTMALAIKSSWFVQLRCSASPICGADS